MPAEAPHVLRSEQVRFVHWSSVNIAAFVLETKLLWQAKVYRSIKQRNWHTLQTQVVVGFIASLTEGTAAQWPFCVEFCSRPHWPGQIAGNLRCPMPPYATPSSGHSIKSSFPRNPATGWSPGLPPFFLPFPHFFYLLPFRVPSVNFPWFIFLYSSWRPSISCFASFNPRRHGTLDYILLGSKK